MTEKYGYAESIMDTLRGGEYRQFPLESVNVKSWRTIASRVNRKVGHKRFSVTVNRTLGFMAIKNNDES